MSVMFVMGKPDNGQDGCNLLCYLGSFLTGISVYRLYQVFVRFPDTVYFCSIATANAIPSIFLNQNWLDLTRVGDVRGACKTPCTPLFASMGYTENPVLQVPRKGFSLQA